MEAAQCRLVERETRGQAGGSHSMTAAAEALRVACRTEIACARGANAVLADEVAFVHDMALGTDALGGQIDVAALAVANRELLLVLVTSEARGHGRKE
jgi:hypothetical protein